jgi:prophage regulatory protein
LNDNTITKALADPIRVLSARQVADVLNLHPVTVWVWQSKGKLPRPIKIGPNKTVWRATDIATWLDEKARETAQQRVNARERDGSAMAAQTLPRWKP